MSASEFSQQVQRVGLSAVVGLGGSSVHAASAGSVVCRARVRNLRPFHMARTDIAILPCQLCASKLGIVRAAEVV